MICIKILSKTSLPLWGLYMYLGQLDSLYKIAAAGRSQQKAYRNLHSLIHRVGLTLPPRIHTVEIPMRKKKPQLDKVVAHYPVILPKTWISYLLENHSKLLLGGHKTEDVSNWKVILKKFWAKYLRADPEHLMNFGGPQQKWTIP